MKNKNEIYFNSLIIDSDYYESIVRYQPSDEYFSLIQDELPKNWTLEKNRIFYSAKFSPNKMPKQGWKIHVSSSVLNSEEVLYRVSKVCFRFNTSFKFLCDKFLLRLSSDKGWPRSSSGKFITIYPENVSVFKLIIEELYSILMNYEGPYILSDKRYKDCKVLYYRYGGMILEKQVDHDGGLLYWLESPTGEKVPDNRLPYFSTPPWVKDPFAGDVLDKSENKNSDPSLKNGRYEIISALKMSNSGGVYLAVDNETSRKVIIKEARPYTIMNLFNNVDAIALRENEWSILNKMVTTGLTPEPIDFFKEWEHTFVVESYLPGRDLYRFAAAKNPLMVPHPSKAQLYKYYSDITKISINLSEAIKTFHSHNIILGDLSSFNVLVDSDLNVTFPDLEGCVDKSNGKIEPIQVTIGFSNQETIKQKNGLSFEHDIYALGCILCNFFSPQNNQYKINPYAPEIFLEEINKDYGLPKAFVALISSLLNNKERTKFSLTTIIDTLKNIEIDLDNLDASNSKNISNNTIQKIINGVSKYIIDTATPERDDRLFPSDPISPNPLNISYGALGVISVLHHLNGSVPKKFIDWILNCDLSEETYPPGLYLGLSGIAWALTRIKRTSYAKKVLDMAKNHPMLYRSFDIYTGIAGFGMTNLHFWMLTKDNKYLNDAIDIGEKLINNKQENERGVFWQSPEGTTYIGYPKGASGIAMFLLYLHLSTNDNRYLEVGNKALHFDLSYANSIEEVLSFPENTSNLNSVSPYWFKGSSGVATTLLRYYVITKDPNIKDKLYRIIADSCRKYTYNPGLFNGLAGLGNLLLDCYQLLEDKKYLDEAYKVAKGIELFKIQRANDSLAFPGDSLFRISNDFGTGASGIGMFLHRLLNQEENFNFILDNLISNRNEHKENYLYI